MAEGGMTVQAQIEQLGQRLDKGFDEIKRMLSHFDERIRKLETTDARDHTLVVARLEEAWKTIDRHDDDLKSLTRWSQNQTKLIERIEMVGKWVIGIVTAVIVALLIAIVSGKIRLTFL